MRRRTGEERPMPVRERYARLLVRHAWVIVGAVALVTAVLVHGIGRLHAEFNVEASLPANHPFVEIDRQIRREFGGRNTMIIAIAPREGDVWQPSVLELVQQVTLEALRLPDVIGQNMVSLAAPSVRYAEERDGTTAPDDDRRCGARARRRAAYL